MKIVIEFPEESVIENGVDLVIGYFSEQATMVFGEGVAEVTLKEDM